MSKVQKFFRYVWRVNAVLIFVAAAGVSFAVVTFLWLEFGGTAGRSRVFDAAPPMGSADSGDRLLLGDVSLVEGTNILRGELTADRSGAGLSSSGGYAEIRNLLFVDSQTHEARWLLPDDDHVITAHPDVARRTEDGKTGRPLATLALVKPAHADLDVADGVLLLLDPSGTHVQTVAEGVRELHTAALDAEGRITLLFERRRKYVLASFDAATLNKRQEHEVAVPPLK